MFVWKIDLQVYDCVGRDAKALQEKTAKKAAQAAGGGLTGSKTSNK